MIIRKEGKGKEGGRKDERKERIERGKEWGKEERKIR